MAGGKGERFWPRSRVNLPKQFLSLTDDGKTMIQLTVERISPLVDIKDVYIATNANYRELVKEQLPGIPEENILCEPIGRNTSKFARKKHNSRTTRKKYSTLYRSGSGTRCI